MVEYSGRLWPVPLWPVPVAPPAGDEQPPGAAERESTLNTPKKEKGTFQIRNNPKSVDKYSSLCYTGLTAKERGMKQWLKTISSLM